MNMVRFNNLVFLSLLLITSEAFAFRPPTSKNHHEYSVFDHPLYALPKFQSIMPKIKPVLMRKYYVADKFKGETSTRNALYAPRSATYIHYDSGEAFVTNADAFFVDMVYRNESASPDEFGTVYLNDDCRVFGLMYAGTYFSHHPPAVSRTTVNGMPSGWRVVGAVRTPDGRTIKLGDHTRWSSPKLGAKLLAVEAVVVPHAGTSGGYVVKFPHPGSMEINGDTVTSMGLVLVQKGGNVSDVDLQPFPAPNLPRPFNSLSPDGEAEKIVLPERDPPVPNQDCPSWLHDLHVTSLEDRWAVSHMHDDEPKNWRTWHPIIDPLYWCYYDHEHGSYPGKSYKPAFAYTAWKTADTGAPDGRQDESHEGFKIFSIPIEAHRTAVITVHMHMSKARRFHARHHTVHYAVLRTHLEYERQEIELEMSFKSDFGPALAHYAAGTPVPMTVKQAAIKRELDGANRRASRVFNVINIDSHFPNSLDKRFRIKGDISKGPKGILNGFYEIWRTTFPSCTAPKTKNMGAFTMDVRDPSTAARFAAGTTDSNIQVMNGAAVLRPIKVKHADITMALQHCFRNIREAVNNRGNGGSFFTDPFFSEVVHGPGKNHVRQFIKPGFRAVTFHMGLLNPTDPWSGPYLYGGFPGFQNIERAVIPMKN